MRRNTFYLSLGSLLCVTTVGVLASCGGGGGGGDDSSLLIRGTISDIAQARTSTRSLSGVTISGLGASDTSDADGNFSLFGDPDTVPAQTVLTVDTTGTGGTTVALNTTGTPPFDVQLTVNADGSVSGTATQGSADTSTSNNSEDSSSDADDTDTQPPVASPIPTATVEPEGTPTIDESSDCFCDDGFGPVAPSFTCPDTGKHPTNCMPAA